jgi:hypothetical protein
VAEIGCVTEPAFGDIENCMEVKEVVLIPPNVTFHINGVDPCV